MEYVLGETLFSASGAGMTAATGGRTVSKAVTARIEYGHSLRPESVGKGAWVQIRLLLNGKEIGSGSSSEPGLSFSSSISVAMVPDQEYAFTVEAKNGEATARSTWVKGILVIG
jgi:hypothetical protein